jgi:PAS domain S-box-containing protein
MDTKVTDYLHLLDHSPMAIIVSDENDRVIFANDQAKDAFGFDLQSPNDTSVRKFHSKHQEKWDAIKEKALSKGFYTFESVAKKQTGGVIDIWVKCEPVSFNRNTGFVTYIRDISDQHIIIREHFKERQFRQLILDAIPAMIFVKDKENRLIAMNKTYQEITGLDVDSHLGLKITDFMEDKDLAESYWEDDMEVIQTGLPKRNIIEPLLTNPDRWFVTDKIPYKTIDGEIIGVIGFSIEITERKNAENALLESEKKFRLLFDTAPDGVILATLDGQIISTNSAFLHMTGYDEEEIKTLGFFDIVADIEKDADIPILRNSFLFGETANAVDRNYRRKDGSIIPVEVKGWIIKDEAGRQVQQGAFIKDVSFKKKVEILETSLAEKEIENLELELEAKNRELGTKIAQLIEKNGLVNSISKRLENLLSKKPKKVIENELKDIIASMKQSKTEDLWKQFEMTFGQINKEFYDNLSGKFPVLTSNERKICAFLKLNLSTKDISSITHQSPRSIEMARTRLRKKMNLTRKDNLTAFLSQI